jgi:Domain of unknown function (DUF4114)
MAEEDADIDADVDSTVAVVSMCSGVLLGSSILKILVQWLAELESTDVDLIADSYDVVRFLQRLEETPYLSRVLWLNEMGTLEQIEQLEQRLKRSLSIIDDVSGEDVDWIEPESIQNHHQLIKHSIHVCEQYNLIIASMTEDDNRDFEAAGIETISIEGLQIVGAELDRILNNAVPQEILRRPNRLSWLSWWIKLALIWAVLHHDNDDHHNDHHSSSLGILQQPSSSKGRQAIAATERVIQMNPIGFMREVTIAQGLSPLLSIALTDALTESRQNSAVLSTMDSDDRSRVGMTIEGLMQQILGDQPVSTQPQGVALDPIVIPTIALSMVKDGNSVISTGLSQVFAEVPYSHREIVTRSVPVMSPVEPSIPVVPNREANPKPDVQPVVQPDVIPVPDPTVNPTEKPVVQPSKDPVQPRSIWSTFNSGVYTVDTQGEITIDYLWDGGANEGEVGIFDLSGMENLVDNLTAFTEEAIRRVLTNSRLGHVVLSDVTEGARFSGKLITEPEDFNAGTYTGSKSFEMKPGSQFGVVMISQGQFKNVGKLASPDGFFFSLTKPSGSKAFRSEQMMTRSTDRSILQIEDVPITSARSDRDYNDLILQITGSNGLTRSKSSLQVQDLFSTNQILVSSPSIPQRGSGF